jgi:hypothetical protein
MIATAKAKKMKTENKWLYMDDELFDLLNEIEREGSYDDNPQYFDDSYLRGQGDEHPDRGFFMIYLCDFLGVDRSQPCNSWSIKLVSEIFCGVMLNDWFAGENTERWGRKGILDTIGTDDEAAIAKAQLDELNFLGSKIDALRTVMTTTNELKLTLRAELNSMRAKAAEDWGDPDDHG